MPPYEALCEYMLVISNAAFHLTAIIDTRNLRLFIFFHMFSWSAFLSLMVTDFPAHFSTCKITMTYWICSMVCDATCYLNAGFETCCWDSQSFYNSLIHCSSKLDSGMSNLQKAYGKGNLGHSHKQMAAVDKGTIILIIEAFMHFLNGMQKWRWVRRCLSKLQHYCCRHFLTAINFQCFRFLMYPRTCSGECEPVYPENFRKNGKFKYCRSQYCIDRKRLASWKESPKIPWSYPKHYRCKVNKAILRVISRIGDSIHQFF